jgi:hypothetical protein
MTRGTRTGQEHAELAMLELADHRAILACRTRRLGAFLHKPALIPSEDCMRGAPDPDRYSPLVDRCDGP